MSMLVVLAEVRTLEGTSSVLHRLLAFGEDVPVFVCFVSLFLVLITK